MKADSLKVAKVFSSGGDVHYILPHFQREYAWDKENWQTLLQDVLSVYEEYDTGNEPEHFMGALVVISDGNRNGTVPAFKLVDGQQRLTTISLALCALARIIESSHAALYKKVQKLLVNIDEEGDLHFKLLPTNKYGDRLAYMAIVSGKTEIPVVESKIPQAFFYLHKELKYHIAQGEVDPEKLFIVFSNCLHVVFIDLDQRERPFEIFESLNHKGKPLTQADLVRNYIAMRLPEKKQESAFDEYWSGIETLLQEKRPVGRSRLGELTSFIRHYLAFRTGNLCNERHVYERFRDRIEREFNTAEAFLGELATLRRFASYYDQMLRPENEPDLAIRERFVRLNTLESGTLYPFVLAVRDAVASGQIGNLDLVETLRILENYLVRRFLAGETTNYTNKMAPTLWRSIEHKNYLPSLKAALAARNYPSNAKLQRSVSEDEVFDPSQPTREKIVLVLTTINRHLSKGTGGETILDGNATIEHILPQTPDSQWKQDLGTDWENVYRECLNTLGNLTLVTQDWNSSLSNASYSNKQPKLAMHALRLNSSYFNSVENWNREAIRKRSEFLLNQIAEIWPLLAEPQTPIIDSPPTPKAVIIAGERYATASWRDVTYYTAERIIQLLGDQFSSFAEELPSYFKKEQFRTASRHLSNGYWVYTNLSIANARNFCQNMLIAAGISSDQWRLDFGDGANLMASRPQSQDLDQPAAIISDAATSSEVKPSAKSSAGSSAPTTVPQPIVSPPLERRFEQAMQASYDDAIKNGYFPTRFLKMLNERGGVGTAKHLLAQSEAQQGLFRLWEVRKLDSSTEALVLRPEFESLFTEDERLEARKRLEALNYFS